LFDACGKYLAPHHLQHSFHLSLLALFVLHIMSLPNFWICEKMLWSSWMVL
jgi:hypothetical protein